MIYARPPTVEERQELTRMTRQAVGRVSQRAQLIRLSAQRHTVPELATLFDMSRATVRLWIRRFDVHGPAGLYDDPRSGRPRKVSPHGLETLVTRRQDDPRHDGYLATCWPVAMLRVALLQRLGVPLSISALRAALQPLGLRWRRPRLTMPTKVAPEKARKQWLMAQAVVEVGPEAAILYADASRLHLLPLLRAMWQWAGQQVRGPTPGTNITRALFGALHIRTGRWVYLVRERMRTDDVLAFLEHLLVAYPTVPLLLIVDNCSRHTAHAVMAWLPAHPRWPLCDWPKYCSHLNPVERIWPRLKNTVAANRLYGSMPLLWQTVDAFFTAMTPEQALTWASACKVKGTY
jgi:transposase